MKKNVLHIAIVFIAGFLGLGSSCETPDLIENDGFNIWCGDQLCYWEVEEGEVKKVKTWHSRDYGASLEGSLVTISQFVDARSYQRECLEFRLQADVDDGVIVLIEVDFDDDGEIEYSHDIVTDNWETVEYYIPTPLQYDGVRFYVRKVGKGRAILARIRAEESFTCGVDPFE